MFPPFFLGLKFYFCSEILRGSEVFFPGEFTDRRASGPFNHRGDEYEFNGINILDYYPDFKQPVYPLSLDNICHVTHLEEAQSIASSGFKFKAFPKRWSSGYSYEKIPCQCNKFLPALPNAAGPQALPGSYSWWSVIPQNPEPPSIEWEPVERGFETFSITDADPSQLFLSDQSIYGTVKFQASFEYVVASYRRKFGGAEVCYKMAGTLRYKHEVCYIIVVCAKTNGIDPLPAMPDLDDLPPIKHPYKTINCEHQHQQHYPIHTTWDHYVVAFHFPKNSGFFRLSSCSLTISKTMHSRCLKDMRMCGTCQNGEFTLEQELKPYCLDLVFKENDEEGGEEEELEKEAEGEEEGELSEDDNDVLDMLMSKYNCIDSLIGCHS